MESIKKKRDLLTIRDLSLEEVRLLFVRAAELKSARQAGLPVSTLAGKTLGMIFEKNSTRTRVSFEAGMFQMGGQAIFLSARDLQLGRGEPIADSARVLSRYVDAIMVRTFEQERLETMALHSRVPVINGLTDKFHPCQVLADIFTFEEKRGSIDQRPIAWIGDGNNMSHSWIIAAGLMGFPLTLACPDGYHPARDVLEPACELNPNIRVVRDPKEAAVGAAAVVTDVWTSMGQEAENEKRLRDFSGYQVDAALMALAAKDALFLHCLPAHRGEEVSAEVLEGPCSVVWDEAENRMHIQKAILEWLILHAS